MAPAGQWSPGTRSTLATARTRGRTAGTCWRLAGGWCTRWCGLGARVHVTVVGSKCWKRCPGHYSWKNKTHMIYIIFAQEVRDYILFNLRSSMATER